MPRALVLCLAFGLALVPAVGRACDDCSGVSFLEPRFSGPIPADGILSFRYGGYWTDADVTLERIDGETPVAVEVAVWLVEGDSIVVVRPMVPLEPGAPYSLSVVAYDYCEIHKIEHHFDVEVGPPGLVVPVPLPASVEFSTRIDLTQFDADIVCCERDEFEDHFELQGCGFGRVFDDRCTSTRGQGRLIADVTADPAGIDPAGQIAYFFTDPVEGPWGWGDHYESLDPFCVTPAALDLVTGAWVKTPSICPDDALVAEVGEHVLDPRDALSCSGILWQCEESQDSGEPECERWRAGAQGCACAAEGGSPPLLALGLVVVLGARRRRRDLS